MVRGIIIPAEQATPIIERDLDGLADYQAAVGGFIEPLTLLAGELTLYVNEGGKQQRRPINDRATALLWQLAPEARGVDVIVGDAVLVPERAENSYLVVSLQRHGFRVEVQVIGAEGGWVRGGQEFDTWFEAAAFSLALQQRFAFVLDARVVPS